LYRQYQVVIAQGTQPYEPEPQSIGRRSCQTTFHYSNPKRTRVPDQQLRRSLHFSWSINSSFTCEATVLPRYVSLLVTHHQPQVAEDRHIQHSTFALFSAAVTQASIRTRSSSCRCTPTCVYKGAGSSALCTLYAAVSSPVLCYSRRRILGPEVAPP
jgi:hypothetical protein